MPALDWTPAVAAVVDADGKVRGTAFFVAEDAALTCHHVLAAAGKGAVSLRPVGSNRLEPVVELDPDEERDLALVRVPRESARCWLIVSEEAVGRGHTVSSYGFPRSRRSDYPEGYPMRAAQIAGPATYVYKGRPVRVFVLNGAAEQGMSGAPLVDADSGVVVGILRFGEGARDEALAVPATVVRQRWPGLPVDMGGEPQHFEDLRRPLERFRWVAWGEFEPSQFHVVVVDSEGGSAGERRATLSALVKAMLARPSALEVWEAFAAACRGRRLVNPEGVRSLPEAYAKGTVKLASFSVMDAFATPDNLDAATRLLVEADVALIDVTGFEPGVMLLLGVRAATRRGLTINSHGAGWREGQPLDRPFNLSDLSLASHTPITEERVGQDRRIDRLVERIRTGFGQLNRQPHYLDMPVYDALRQLGSQEDAWSSIPLDEEVLVLCSYHERYFDTWEALAGQVSEALSEREILSNVVRLQDRATPQLVSQSLYERIRRCAGCVADWTLASPSTFFELGVRLAVSPWSVVQIVDRAWLADPTRPDGTVPLSLEQLGLMRDLFNPIPYDDLATGDDTLGWRIVEQLVAMREQIRGRGGHRIRQVAADALSRTQEQLPNPVERLNNEADALNHLGRVRSNVPQALFYEVDEIKRDEERAAREHRLAAWLYLEHRLNARDLPADDDRRRLWLDLGEAVAADLLASAEEEDVDLALKIEERLG